MPSTKLWLFAILVFVAPVLAAVLLQQYMFAGLSAPPADFGSGSMFDSIAVRYDMINRVLAAGMDIGWRERMVEIIKESVLANEKQPLILDVATGTADVALLLAKAIPNAKITGVDPSQNMLHVGRQKVAQHGLSGTIRLEVHDAQQDFSALSSLSTSTLPMMFDAATMSFGIRNVPDRETALCQIHKVLREGARFCVLEFSEPAPDTGFLGAVARQFIRYVVPVLGGVLSGQPREYWHLQNSIQDFPSPKEFGELLEHLDCADGAFRLDELIQLNYGSVQLYVSTALRQGSDGRNEKEPIGVR